MKILVTRAIMRTVLFAAVTVSAQCSTVPAGEPLRIQVDHRYRIKVGATIQGHLTVPAYYVDHEVLAAGTLVSGTIVGKHPAPRAERVRAMLDGDFIPPAIPEIRFEWLEPAGSQRLAIQTSVMQRDAVVVKMTVNQKHSSLSRKVRDQIQARRREAMETLRHPNLKDRVQKWVYAQLPWHPQMIWTGTQYDATLTTPLVVPGPSAVPMPQADLQETPSGIVEARLTTPLDSLHSRRDTIVTAVISAPLLTEDGKQVIFPAGTEISGIVTIAQPARWFARNGKLHFTFRSVDLRGRPSAIHGQLAAAEAAEDARVQLSEEGTAQAKSGPQKYLAPLALGLLAANTYGDDAERASNSAVTSNGFGFAARVAAMAAANAAVARGFAYFALSKSIYRRWIARGHEVDFPKNTRIEILLNKR